MPTDRKRRHSFTRSGSGSPPPEALISNVTNSRDPKLLNARVFIGGLPSEVITKPEVEERFGQYGRVLGISIHRKFGFVQFENETDGRAACTGENLTFWHGVKLDVHMAADGMRRGGGMDRRSPGLARDMRGGPPPPRMSRDRSPPFRRPGPPEQFDREPPRWEREDNFRRDEPRAYYRDDSFRDREMFRERDREREEPYGRNRRPPPAEPYHDRRGNGREEPYSRREPYPEREREREREREPYHEPYPRERPTPPPPPPPPPPSNPIECEIVVMSRTIREYGEYIDKRLRELGLSTGILFLAEEASLQQALDDITRRHCLYAVVTNVQNEAHRSMTLNILHGTPQEHRNMPLEDALSLVARNFAEFGKKRRERQQPAAAVAARPAVPPVVPPVDNSINHLLGMLSDSKYLSVEQLGRVIAYLEDRRLRQAEIEGHPLAASNHAGSARSLPGAASAAAAPAAVVENPNDLLKQQQELQAKILSVLNKPAANPPMSGGNKAAQPPAPSYGNYGGAQPQTPTSVAGINLDNPNIQKAIDNLINSGPRLLQNLTSVSSQSASTLSKQDAPTSTQQPAVPNPAPSIHSAVAPQQQQQWRPLVQWPKQQAQVASRPPHVLQQQQQQHHQQQQHQQQQHQQQRHHQQQQQIQQQQMQQQQMQQQQQHNDELQQGGLGLLGDAPNAYMY